MISPNYMIISSSIQRTKAPKAGSTKTGASPEDLAEWKESLDEVMGEVKKLEVVSKY
jgi:hypothetical protein